MSRSRRLTIVVDLAEKVEKESADVYRQAQAMLDEDLARLKELKQYISEYQNSMQVNSGVNPSTLMRNRAFIHQLYEAVDQQEALVAQRQTVVDSKKAVWHKHHMKYKGLVEFVDKVKMDESRLQDKKEEKILDDWFNQLNSMKDC